MGAHERLVMKHLRQDEALQLDSLMELLFMIDAAVGADFDELHGRPFSVADALSGVVTKRAPC